MGTFYDAVVKMRKNGRQMKPSKPIEQKGTVKTERPIERKGTAKTEVNKHDKGTNGKS